MKDEQKTRPIPGDPADRAGALPARPASFPLHPVVSDHRRDLADNRYVYAVVSRRSRGVSVGVNLNPDKVCNFDCVYCQVDRTTPGADREVEVPRLRAELETALDLVASGELFALDRYRNTPPALRRLNDIAFSGDGEPTTCHEFPQAVEAAALIKRRRGLDDVKLVLITNATVLDRPEVRRALEVLHASNGEVWAKLDAGTEDYYHRIERTNIPLGRVLDNILRTARAHPVVIQSMFLRLDREPPSAAEQEAFCERLNEVVRGGGKIKLVQVYTVARRPAEPTVTPLTDAEVDALTELVRRRTGLPAEPFHGVG
jgi:wyosine [tRNA(Phe)-imidazoG37] synthetase (radical SAM superfamily)